MATPVAPQTLTPLIVMGVAMAFVVYRRVQRQIGRQSLIPRRMKVRMGFLCLVAVVIVALSATLPILAAAAAGAVAGAALGLYAAHLARIEREPEGLFYTGNIYIGVAVSALLVARIGYRFIVATTAVQAAPMTPQEALANSVGNPLTIGILLVTVSYYVAYYAGLMRKARHP